MSVDIMADFTFMSRYPCYLKEQGRREVWEETVNRSRDMHKSKYPQLSLEIDDIFDNYVLTKRVLGSQRTLRYAGPAMFQHNARGYNCAATYADRPAFFKEMLYLLLCGTGVGFSVQHHHIKSMPKLYTGDKTGIFTHQIEDTIEGWCDALDVLINSYLEYDDNPYKEYNNSIINFDYSKIRPKGSSFSHGCGIAPGYEPIQISLNNISNFFKSLVNSGVYIMRPIHIYDIAMYAAEAVISGGIRYSATLCIFSPDDSEMLMAKTGDWHIYNPQRRMSNNSVLLLRDSTSLEDFDSVIKYTKEFGEPGFIWSDNIDTIYNPCLEIGLYAYTLDGKSGFQMCNLSEINGKLVQSKEDFMDVARAAAILGTLQAGYTDFPYLGSITESIVRRESLIGVGITGIMDSPTILLNPEYQREAAEIVKATNKEITTIIGINQAARTTCVKPSGSTSLILGTASGIHPHYGRKYLKRIRANKNDRLFEYFKSYNPGMVEDDSSWISSDNDSLVVFPIEVSDDAIVWNDMDAISMLENVKLTYDNWIKSGINHELCVIPSLSHSVSNTIMLEENEWDRCVSFIYQNRQSFTGVSMLGKISEKAYFQPPYAMVYDMDDIIDRYGDLVSDMLAADLINEGIKLFGGQGWKSYMFMNNGWQDNTDPSIQEWISKLILLSNKYYDGDVSRVMDCYYDMFNLYMFVTLRNSNVTVDYTRLTEINGMSLSLDPACAGGGCVI